MAKWSVCVWACVRVCVCLYVYMSRSVCLCVCVCKWIIAVGRWRFLPFGSCVCECVCGCVSVCVWLHVCACVCVYIKNCCILPAANMQVAINMWHAAKHKEICKSSAQKKLKYRKRQQNIFSALIMAGYFFKALKNNICM